VTPDGTITTVAGTVDPSREYGLSGFGGDGGPATSALLCRPAGVAALSDGGFLIADTGNQVVRKVAADGISDQVDMVVGGRLPIWVAANVIGEHECDDGCEVGAPDTTEGVGRCRRFALRRVDCRIDASEIGTCEWVGSAVLRPSGFVWTRRYPCPMRRVLRRPRPLAPAPLPQP
jgi:hypothetical protein